MPASTVNPSLPPARPEILRVAIRAGVGVSCVFCVVLWSPAVHASEEPSLALQIATRSQFGTVGPIACGIQA